ncbi:MAG: hypothetical protein Q9174_007429, partial [Haloplaca sp. 1 TL-2023]
MIILAVYYTFADIVLLGQCFYYRGFTLSDPQPTANEDAVVDEEATEESPLLAQNNGTARRSSSSSFRSHLSRVDATHLSPATPLIAAPTPTADPPAIASQNTSSTFRAVL